MAILSQLAAALCIALLRWLAERHDLKENARNEIRMAAEEYARKALEWKAGAVTSPDGGATLRVRDGARPISLPGENPNP